MRDHVSDAECATQRLQPRDFALQIFQAEMNFASGPGEIHIHVNSQIGERRCDGPVAIDDGMLPEQDDLEQTEEGLQCAALAVSIGLTFPGADADACSRAVS
mmetsp:Transcript_10278/g.27022  ORF Transcript_10278/g.27022 Transcript_10278/m.27022 type:complete len:102 (-) Transcript_10278:205-510(-)